jgi:hypothetical protein
MPTPGYVFKDGGATPPSTPPPEHNSSTASTTMASKTAPQKGEKLRLSESGEAPTESHALAMADPEEKGAAQKDHGAAEVKNVGWNADPKDTSNLVGGLPNPELWTLVRRFNKVQTLSCP